MQALISGHYSHQQVHLVVAKFAAESKRLLAQKEFIGWQIRDFQYDSQAELETLAIDFIAPLFARDEQGVFCLLKKQFQPLSNLSNNELFTIFQRLVYAHVHQEFIRLFQERDPVGKILYRSLRYLLGKHSLWVKVKSADNLTVITLSGQQLDVITDSDVILDISKVLSTDKSLTGIMESYLEKTLVSRRQSVPLHQLFQAFRTMVQHDIEWLGKESAENDSIIKLTIDQRISETLKHIDGTMLCKYVATKKLTLDEQQLFRLALRDMLQDFSNGGVSQTYASYLNQHTTIEISDDCYADQYKKQFEYAAKTAKQDFSVRVRTDFNP